MAGASSAYKALVQSNYRAWCYHVHEGRWKPGALATFLTEKVQQFIETETGNAYDILCISVPPQHGKSMSVTETLPSWYLCRWPHKRVIEISYSEDFAQLFGRRNKSKIEKFGHIFRVNLASSPNSNTEFETEAGGGMISRGALSGVTGRPCELMIIDDPIKTRQDADSENHRNKIWDEWENSWKSRLAAGAKVIVIQTRWHEDDLTGRIINQEKNVTVINIPCEAEENDPLGRKPGQALAPEIGKDDKWLQQFKEGYSNKSGSRAWNALYQGRPTSAEGNLLKREWWQFYTEAPQLKAVILSVDASFKGNEDNDYVSIQVWGKRDANYYLLDRVKDHFTFLETLEAIRATKAKYPEAHATLIEDKANGSAIIDVLRKEITGIIAVNPEGGKIARVNAVSGAIEAGQVYLPKYAAFTGEFIEECAAFPNAAHDDDVDCMSQALNRLIYYSGTIPEINNPVYNFDFERPKRNPSGIGEKVRVL